MKNKNTQISLSLKKYHRKRKQTHKVKMVVASILMSIGLLLAGYQGIMQVKFNILIAQAESIDAITEDQASKLYSEMIGWDASAQAEVIPLPKAEAVNQPLTPTVKERAFAVLEKRGVSDNFKKNFTCLLQHENRKHNPYALLPNKHRDGSISIDRGLLQWNSKTAPITISDECVFSVECSVNKFIDYVENNPAGWNRWFGYKNNCI